MRRKRKSLNSKGGSQSGSNENSPSNSPEKKKTQKTMPRSSSQLSLSSTSSRATFKQPGRKSIQANNPPDFTSPNQFSSIAPHEMDHNDEESSSKPPPIQVKGITDFLRFCNELKKLVGATEFSCRSRIDITTIKPETSDAYRGIIRFLKSSGLQYYTYQLKEEKSFRIVIRHLHPSTPEVEIKQALDELGFKVRHATCVLQSRTKIPLPLFFVHLEPAMNNKEIFSLKRLLYSTIVVEEPHRKENIVQCQKCQGFNHTKNFCELTPACVKCAGTHLTAECPKKTREEKAKCVHCQGEHPANYKGCTVYQQLLRQRRNTRQQGSSQSQPPPRQRSQQRHPVQEPQVVITRETFPPAISISGPSQSSSHQSQAIPAQKFTPRTSQSTYAQVVKPPPSSSFESLPQTLTSTLNDLNTVTSSLNSFLNELRSLITPLILLIQKLCPIPHHPTQT